MNPLYTLGIYLYRFLLICASPFNPKAKKMLRGRRNWRHNLEKAIDTNATYVWFHCSSLGEFEQGRPLIEAYKERYPNKKIILTFFSPSGYEIRKNYELADIILYLPFDTKKNAQFFIKKVNPEQVFFVKYDFWYHTLRILNKHNIDTFLVSAIFRKDQLFFKWYGVWYKNILSYFKLIFVQDEDSRILLYNSGIEHCIVAGDTRFDRVGKLPSTVFNDDRITTFCKNSRVFVCGSTWLPDEELIANFANTQMPDDVKILIAPHEIDSKHIKQIENLFLLPTVKYSNDQKQDLEQAKILIIDSIGKLSYLYRYGTVAYIGGGFGVGIHNTLEAAVYGIPVIFGPNFQRFKEACDLIKQNAAFSISNQNSFNNTSIKLLSDKQLHKNTSARTKAYVTAMQGATQAIMSKALA